MLQEENRAVTRRPEIITGCLRNIGLTLQSAGVTGDEYIIILHNLVAQLLSENIKRTEKDFFEFVRRDVLQRRLKKLRAEETIQHEMEFAESKGPWIDEAAEITQEAMESLKIEPRFSGDPTAPNYHGEEE